MKLSDCKSLDDLARFRDGATANGAVWFISETGFTVTLFPCEYKIILNYSCSQFIWRDGKRNERYEELYNDRKEAEQIAYLKRIKVTKETLDRAKEELEGLLAHPPEDK